MASIQIRTPLILQKKTFGIH